MKCPIDGSELVISERQGVEIDYCPQCRGVWLDRGELDKILERMAVPRPEERPAAYSDNRSYGDNRGYSDDPRYKHKRKKSFFEELFD